MSWFPSNKCEANSQNKPSQDRISSLEPLRARLRRSVSEAPRYTKGRNWPTTFDPTLQLGSKTFGDACFKGFRGRPCANLLLSGSPLFQKAPLDRTQIGEAYLWIFRLIPHSFQPSFFSRTSHFPSVFAGFLKRRIPEKNGEATPRMLVVSHCLAAKPGSRLEESLWRLGTDVLRRTQGKPLSRCLKPGAGKNASILVPCMEKRAPPSFQSLGLSQKESSLPKKLRALVVGGKYLHPPPKQKRKSKRRAAKKQQSCMKHNDSPIEHLPFAQAPWEKK